ncbi:hypothetical protein GTR04_2065 [Trichophyton interdigitale]|uniref:Uncharacterized protein n=1 Tax=Trichophyton interdigitale TaxID=101480 RepID=A0A9P4YMH2_9EURO|nr:hypothetical protein GY632_1660 [Trichophyton interdigitale]KAF3900550.1 hypothetical protein GY631_0056 [Trichophyton interdigitale]KAG8210559.1 hypothetical protein GTR04_2065 [Trichophyton interdigitale]
MPSPCRSPPSVVPRLQPNRPLYINQPTSLPSQHRAIQHRHGGDGRRFGNSPAAARKQQQQDEEAEEDERETQRGRESAGTKARPSLLSPWILASKPSVILFFRVAISTGPPGTAANIRFSRIPPRMGLGGRTKYAWEIGS